MTSATLTEELKPCPFDGAPAGFRWCGGVLIAECTKCGVSKSGKGISWEEDIEMTCEQREAALKANAAEAWNRRPQPEESKCAACNGSGYAFTEECPACTSPPTDGVVVPREELRRWESWFQIQAIAYNGDMGAKAKAIWLAMQRALSAGEK